MRHFTHRLNPTAMMLLGCIAFSASAAPALKVMLITGQSNQYHDWTKTAPLVKTFLEQTGLFAVDLVTTPPKGADMSGFSPGFRATRLS